MQEKAERSKDATDNRNQAMMEMLRGRAVRCGAAIGGEGGSATSAAEGKPGGGTMVEYRGSMA